MPRCAKLSVLIVLAGTLTASAAPLNSLAPNRQFQPGSAVKPAILRPAMAVVLRPATKPVQIGKKRSAAAVVALKPNACAISPAGSGRAP